MRRTQRLKWWITAIVGICFISVLWIFYQSRQPRNGVKIPLPPEAVSQAIMALSKVHQTASQDGQTQWELNADAAELEAGTGKMILQAPNVNFFLEDGTRIEMTAREGILYTKTNDMEIRGKVHIRNDRYTLKTESLTYEHDHRVLLSDSAVHITSAAIELKAATMRYDLNTNQTQFDGQVEGILYENPAL